MYSRYLLFVNFLYIVFFLINRAEGEAPEFQISINDRNESVLVNFKKVENSYLVNVHLPVWKTTNNKLQPYKEIEVMSKNESITSYFNYEKKAAVIYSSSCDCLNGVIGMRYTIKNFPMQLINFVQYIGYSTSIKARRIKSIKRPNLYQNDAPTSERNLKMNERAINKTLYPEILIVATNDFYTNRKAVDDKAIVFYIISLMNAADMLYSPAENLKVKLNIAGIIIESQQNQLPVMAEPDHREFLSTETLIYNVMNSNNSYFDKFKLNPKMSYDWIFFLTSKKLSFYDQQNVRRMSSYPKRGIVKSRQEGCNSFNTPISIFIDDYEFISFPTIGHETFHLIIHGSHEQVEKSICQNEFLSANDVPYLEQFQWSDDCCLLTNKPQSLNFQQPPMNPMYQCQCYGYEKSDFINPTECTQMLTCEDASRKKHNVPRIVDDEFCQEKWERKKLELQQFVQPSRYETSLSVDKQCSWIIPSDDLSNLMFVFPEANKENNDDGLVCLAIVVEEASSGREIVLTGKSCVVKPIKLRRHLIQAQGKKTIAESQSEADFSILKKPVDPLLHDIASLVPNDFINDNFIKLSSLKNTTQFLNSKFDDCRFINVTRVSDSIKPFIIQYVRIDISIQKKTKGSDSDWVIISKNPVDKSELGSLKGNPLFCKSSDDRAELVGILVRDDFEDGHLQFVNIADYKNVLEGVVD